MSLSFTSKVDKKKIKLKTKPKPLLLYEGQACVIMRFSRRARAGRRSPIFVRNSCARSTRLRAGWLGLGVQSACDYRVENGQLVLTEKQDIHGLPGTCVKPTELNSPTQLYPAFVNSAPRTPLPARLGSYARIWTNCEVGTSDFGGTSDQGEMLTSIIQTLNLTRRQKGRLLRGEFSFSSPTEITGSEWTESK